MNAIYRFFFLNPQSNNRKSKTCPFDKLRAGSELCRRSENRKLVGLVTLAVASALCWAVAETQQTGKIPRIG